MALVYGNPAFESIEMIRNSILIQEWRNAGYFVPLLQMPFPDETQTIKELWYLVDLSNGLDSVRLNRCKFLDTNLFDAMSELLDSFGIKESGDQIYQKIQVYDPIIDYLKIIYNRPRPFQTAYLYKVPLFPKVKTDASDSSYPSGHTLMSLFFYHEYGKVYPDLKKPLLDFVYDVKLSREEGGVHYPSDGLFSFKVYKELKKYM